MSCPTVFLSSSILENWDWDLEPNYWPHHSQEAGVEEGSIDHDFVEADNFEVVVGKLLVGSDSLTEVAV